MSYLFPTYARWEVEPVSAEGTYLTDINGKTYLDYTSGIGVCNLGHQPKMVKEAVSKQLDHFWHVSNLFTIGQQEKAAQLLATAAGLEAVFFANSGAEANEGAIKLARKATGKTKIITFEKSFHGRTFATMSATGQDKIKIGYGPMLEKFVYVPFNDIEALKKEMDTDVAAIMLEVIQGEGGIHVGETAFLKEVEELCKEYGALLIIDEIQTGIGRTAKPFAFQHFELSPDIVTVAKGLGSGLPIGAVIGKESLKVHFGPGSHGSTFGGNPVSIQAAIATMEIIFNEVFLQEVLIKGEYLVSQLTKKLQNQDSVKGIRGLGLMIGIEFDYPVQNLLAELRQEGFLALSAGENVLRLLPPLTTSISEIDESIEIMKNTIGNTNKAVV
ncbi:acetylornithine transaminase [Robertmurraya kyonggiensis]|uniref:Acetylornithine aminotransferase n=1 Tax=Robertmurraya kyonggiensis TaxID=1037680 RepID=A0A4U1D700_9BACI|nr:acetylornithine transaminase [Robertmurraya kyonggiensis]TKC18261.1 acetylornithine transaminase [Robertmurraya kyonggiensis]